MALHDPTRRHACAKPTPVTLASSYRIIDDFRAGRMGKLAPAEVVTSGYSDADAETVIAEMKGRRL